MANCVGCSKSNLGVGATKLLWLDGSWYCQQCLRTQKGSLACQGCKRLAFSNDDHFKTIDGRLLCQSCILKAGLTFSILAPVSKPGPSSGAASTGDGVVEPLASALDEVLKQHLQPGEQVHLAINGNPGEALALTNRRVLVLKSGMAAGSLLAKKACAFAYPQITNVKNEAGPLVGVFALHIAGAPAAGLADVNQAKKADNAITYLAKSRDKFDRALQLIRQRRTG